MEENKLKEEKIYFTQIEIAKKCNTTPRMLLYWENQGLIHPEISKESSGKNRRYTLQDLKQIKFVKGLIDEGYTTPVIKKRLSLLEPSFSYDLEDLLWDYKDKIWKTKRDLARGYLKKEFQSLMSKEDPPAAIINYVFDLLEEE